MRYSDSNIFTELSSAEATSQFASRFYSDVAEIYEFITRITNSDRNPSGFSLNDAPILGLLIKIWRLLREVVVYYENENAYIISLLERPLIEASTIALYLLSNGEDVIQDYRKCSYKDRLRILRELKSGSAFFETKPGKRLLKSVKDKLALENFTENDFETQKSQGWRLSGKPFYTIFKEVHPEELYKYSYGIMSEAVHASWNDSMDFNLHNNNDGTFSAFTLNHPADIRYVTPTIKFCNNPFRLWLKRIEADTDFLMKVLDWIDTVNTKLYFLFDEQYDG